MHQFIFANKDTTLYSDNIDQNTGKDEILEIIKGPYSASYYGVVSGSIISRALINFDISAVSRSIVAGDISANARFYLNMYVCSAEGQPETTSLYIYPVNSSWIQGAGKRYDSITRTKGASWQYRDGETSLAWSSTGSDFINSESFAQLWSDENQFQNSGHYTYELADLRADVTPIVRLWLSGSANNGFIVKRTGSEEEDTKNYGIIRFYSTDTHTVYNPKLEVAWDDSSFVTGSTMTASDATDLFVFIKQIQTTYNNRDKARFKVGSRTKYPAKSYVTSNPYSVNWYLPTSSYYSIVDSQTEETIIPFDTGSTKLSLNSNGNYFDFYMNSLHPERYYRIKIKVVSGSFQQVFEIPQSFKVVR
jgi:hypothetical protein